ncbi:MAG: glycosyltransferase family 4 protein [Myroides sp.]|jgi:glycosyltransferase EpsD|nr:glycosyltransferase family 4 protein [Myroides sp.]
MLKKKVLFVATVSGHINAFHLPYIEWMSNEGYIVDVACDVHSKIEGNVNKVHDIKIARSPFTIKHINAYKELKEVIDNGLYDLITCHTPMASVLARLASREARRKGTKVLYTAHGFHFFKGGPLLNWLVFYPIERYLTNFTDGLVCINQPDYDIISKKGNQKCDYFKIPGIGVREDRYFPVLNCEEKILIRKEKNFSTTKFLGIYAAEFIPRKNHFFILNAFKQEKNRLNDVQILFAGRGELEEELKIFVQKNGLEKNISFIGFRRDLDEVFRSCDFGISASKQEGLPINIVEEMLSGLPIIASIERGHLELVRNSENGFLFNLDSSRELVDSIIKLKDSGDFLVNSGKKSRVIGEEYRLENSMKSMIAIFRKYL